MKSFPEGKEDWVCPLGRVAGADCGTARRTGKNGRSYPVRKRRRPEFSREPNRTEPDQYPGSRLKGKALGLSSSANNVQTSSSR
jgi:hypothetical protein